jgi:hypothetical protein
MIFVEISLIVWHCKPQFAWIKPFRILFVAAALRATATAELSYRFSARYWRFDQRK